MKCPECGHSEDKVVDSRTTKEGEAIRRRRECLRCGKRFTTYEYIEKVPLMVIKKDGRREPYSRVKLLKGLMTACEKRPVSRDQLEDLIDDVEKATFGKFKHEIHSADLGNEILERLHSLDEVAYVRFASVYRQFKDVTEFLIEIKSILEDKNKGA
ncbi:MAG: transcriptional regulator NrdR [bacterium]